MKANELRIGNYVYSQKCNKPETVCTVTGYLANDVWFKYEYKDMWFGNPAVNEMPCSISKLLPIPITKEWLVRLGFEELTSEYVIEINDENELRLGYWTEEDEPNYKGENEWCYVWDNCEKYVLRMPKYIHEVQNLYFVLTGKELSAE